MAQLGQTGTSRSLAIYGLLLELYPQAYLQQHRAELLQNFEDLEQASTSRTALWLFIGKDLAVSLRSQFTKTLWGQTAIVLAVLAVLLVLAERHPGEPEHAFGASATVMRSDGSPDASGSAGKPAPSAAFRAMPGRSGDKPPSS